jgi:hypothetical protein
VGLILNVEEIATLFHRSRDFFRDHGTLPPAVPGAAANTKTEEARA